MNARELYRRTLLPGLLAALTLQSAAADPSRARICFDYGCKSSAEVRFDASDWDQIEALFATDRGAAVERDSLAAAVALLERIAGAQAGTGQDRGGNVDGSGLPGQMDCIDESTNTTTYLNLLAERGLLRHHRVATRQMRAPWLLDQHWTAVVQADDGQHFAVDSWFLYNGLRPYVQPLEAWLDKADLPPHPDLETRLEPILGR